MSFVVFSCQNCNAPLDCPPDSLLVVCRYCGGRHPAKTLESLSVSIVPSLSEQKLIEFFHRRMSEDKQMKGVQFELLSMEGVYIPIFTTSCTFEGEWHGTRPVKYGTVPTSGTVNTNFEHPILARKNTHEFGVEQIGRVLSKQQRLSMDSVDWQEIGLSVLAVDVTEKMANLRTYDEATERVGKQLVAEGFTTHITALPKCRMTERSIILFPFWMAQYKFEGGIYRAAISGGDGEMLAVMEPISQKDRIVAWRSALIWIFTLGVWSVITSFLMDWGEDYGNDGLGMLGLVSMYAGVIYGGLKLWKAVQTLSGSVRVEVSGLSDEVLS